MDYKVFWYKILIYDCYKYKRSEMLPLLEEAKKNFPNYCIWERSMYSILCEWRVHKLLYKLGIRKDNTKDADIECNIDPKLEKWYKFIGFFL